MVSVVIIGLMIVFPKNGYCIFGMGDIVSDPASYAYFVEQISVATEELEKVKEQVETAKGTLDEAQKMRSSMEGVYNQAIGTIEYLKHIQKEITETPTAMQKYAENFLDFELGSGESWINAEDILKNVFIDPRTITNQTDKFKNILGKFQLRQKTLEQVINKADKIHAALPEKFTKIKELASRIDAEDKGLKYSQDLSNTILTEILAAITELTSLIGYIGQAQAIVHFEGVDDESAQQHKNDLEANKGIDGDWMNEYLKKQGVNPESSARDEVLKMLE